MPEPELHLAPPPDRNSLTPTLLIAALVMLAIGAAVYFLNPRKTAEVSVQKVDLFAPHTVFKEMPSSSRIIGALPSSEDDVYVVATLSITDKLRLPIFLSGSSAALTTASGQTVEATMISATDLPRLEQTFPQILPLVSPPAAPPINFGAEEAVAPSATRIGTVVMLFPQATAATWHARKSATLTIELAHDATPLTVTLP
jgi:hypothetical protein